MGCGGGEDGNSFLCAKGGLKKDLWVWGKGKKGGRAFQAFRMGREGESFYEVVHILTKNVQVSDYHSM